MFFTTFECEISTRMLLRGRSVEYHMRDLIRDVKYRV